MKCEEHVKRKIVRFSQGLPHYTHLLALHACQSAIKRSSQIIDEADFTIATDQALNNALKLKSIRSDHSQFDRHYELRSLSYYPTWRGVD